MLPLGPLQARFLFPCFWHTYLNFDTSPSFLRSILELLTARRTLRPVILDSLTGCCQSGVTFPRCRQATRGRASVFCIDSASTISEIAYCTTRVLA